MPQLSLFGQHPSCLFGLFLVRQQMGQRVLADAETLGKARNIGVALYPILKLGEKLYDGRHCPLYAQLADETVGTIEDERHLVVVEIILQGCCSMGACIGVGSLALRKDDDTQMHAHLKKVAGIEAVGHRWAADKGDILSKTFHGFYLLVGDDGAARRHAVGDARCMKGEHHLEMGDEVEFVLFPNGALGLIEPEKHISIVIDGACGQESPPFGGRSAAVGLELGKVLAHKGDDLAVGVEDGKDESRGQGIAEGSVLLQASQPRCHQDVLGIAGSKGLLDEGIV